MKYYVMYEPTADGGWGAYPPDLPGVGIVAATREGARASVRKAIEMHLAGLREDGEPVPEPSGEFVEVA
ncbi:MAG: type II toxin-antitoxin system HicB family antitoxin [Candidatus Dormibacteria bacterium]